MKDYLAARAWLIVLMLVYVGAVGLFAALLVAPRGVAMAARGVDYRATRELRTNHRVAAPDLRPLDGLPGSFVWRFPDRNRLEGKYVVAGVQPGAPLLEANVRDWPDLAPGSCHTAMAFASSDEALDAGALVDVCPASGDCIQMRARVIAVICGKSTACYAVVAVPSAREQDVRAALKKDKVQLRIIAL